MADIASDSPLRALWDGAMERLRSLRHNVAGEDVDDHHGHPCITPNSSHVKAIVTLFLSSTPAFFGAGWLTNDFLSIYPNLAVACVALGGLYAKLAGTLPTVDVPVQYVAVKTVHGLPVNVLLAPGYHPLFWGEGGELVSTEPLPYDPPSFQVLARDEAAVHVDAYFMATIVDPYLWRTQGGEETAGMLIAEFTSKIRLFVQNMERARQITEIRDVLADYLKLDCEKLDEIKELMGRLRDLKTDEGKHMFREQDIKKLEGEAGKFCSSARAWGYHVTDINTEDVDLDPEVRKAAADRSAQEDRLKAFHERREVRIASTEKFIGLGIDPQAALTAVDADMGTMDVRRESREYHIPALTSATAPLGKLMSALTPEGKQQPKKGTDDAARQ